MRIVKLNAIPLVTQCCELVASYFPFPLPNHIKREIERLCISGVPELEIANHLVRQYFIFRTDEVKAQHDAIANELRSSSPNPVKISSLRATALSYAYNDAAWQALLDEILQNLQIGEHEVSLLFPEFLSGTIRSLKQAEAWNARRLKRGMQQE